MITTRAYLLIVAALAAEKLLELALSARNRKIALAAGAIESGHDHYVFMSAFHVLFLLALVLEKVWLRASVSASNRMDCGRRCGCCTSTSLLGARDARSAMEHANHHLPQCCARDGRPVSLPAPSQLPGRDNRNGLYADDRRMLADRDRLFAGQCGVANGAHSRGREVAR